MTTSPTESRTGKSNETKESPALSVIHELRGGDLDPFMNETCPVWCQDRGKHTFDIQPEDRNHFGESRRVPMQLESMPGGGGVFHVATAVTYLHQNYRAAEPTVWVGEQDSDGVMLTLGEAKALAEALLATIEEAGR